MSAWRIQTSHLLLPKSGLELSECEDAVAINETAGRFAIADGATEAFDSQSWARLLVKDWVSLAPIEPTPDAFWSYVAGQARTLHDSWQGLRLSWYAEEKARTGSFAAFVGVQLDLEGPSPNWQAIALGDSCLIHCRDGEILTSLPIAKSEDFNTTPPLVPSQTSLQSFARDKMVNRAGVIEEGDVLLLLSDAVAYWFLRPDESTKQARSKFDLLLKTNRESELGELFSTERACGRIPDDDIAAIRIAVGG
jgi:hypothetical protein